MNSTSRYACLAVAASLLLASGGAHAGVLPDDRADLLWHHYDADGLTIQGASLLVRKTFGDHYSVAGNYYSDTIDDASIDVVTHAMTPLSPQHERRQLGSLSVDVQHGKSTYSAGYITSDEIDYKAKTAFATVSEDLFGDLTTISFGYTRGWDKVGEVGTSRNDAVDRRNWRVGLTQILTRNLLLDLNFETAEDEGFLNNPYRQVRFLDQQDPLGYRFEPELYPHTRTGNAGAGELKYHLPWHAALDGSYRYYSDTWGIVAHTAQLGYTQPLFHSWLLDFSARHYRQNHADFYADLFPYSAAQNFLARDRQLATFKSLTLGLGLSWELRPARWSWLEKGTLNLRWDHTHTSYDDFRDLRVTGFAAGTEPLYTLDADALQFFISAWF